MINGWYSNPGYLGTELVLSGVASDGTTAISETIRLIEGVDYRSIGNSTTNVNNRTPCDVANIGTAALGVNCTGDADETAQTMGTDTGFDLSNAALGITISVYNNLFTGINGVTGGKSWLDAQEIYLGWANPFANGWLNTITVTNFNGTGTGTQLTQKTILSAITVETATPEPGTVFLLLGGFAAIVVLSAKRGGLVRSQNSAVG